MVVEVSCCEGVFQQEVLGDCLFFYNARRVCANPSSDWVKRTMKKIDRRLSENSTHNVTV
ncbi:hypothetical protein C0J50_13751 [Silurus asotus]|uniref:Chemokine interleukin-8-like domain-containing protein n=1 Tax=Silurus asotus TaxID=30991 RepID=A0AAD5B210_SILAS|nr:hypothetical protein C0J50_13751 [Silurus asotus]